MKKEILNLIGKSLLLDIETKKSLRLKLETLSEEQMAGLLEILKKEREILGKIIRTALQDPVKRKNYENFIKSFSLIIRNAYKTKEEQVNREEENSLKEIEAELANI